MSQLSMESLFAAARADAPDDETRDAMWNSVAGATGIAAGATVVAAATRATSTAAKPAVASAGLASLGTKLVVLGLLACAVAGGALAFGSMESTIGVAPASPVTAPIARTVRVPARGAQLADRAARARDSRIDRPEPSAPHPPITSVAPSTSPAPSSATSDLAEEARLVTEARSALVGGDPAHALTLLRRTHRFATRALEPEELSLEARALRALGRADEAAATDMSLKSRFPGHALAR